MVEALTDLSPSLLIFAVLFGQPDLEKYFEDDAPGKHTQHADAGCRIIYFRAPTKKQQSCSSTRAPTHPPTSWSDLTMTINKKEIDDTRMYCA